MTVAIKGAVQKYFEAQANTPEVKLRELEIRLGEAVEAGEITREQASERFVAAAAALVGKNGEMPSRVPANDITTHSLYQQTIKEVLSEDAFAQYTTRQAEKADFLKRTSGDTMVAYLDAQMFLKDAQRKQFELTVSKLAFSSSSERPVMDLFSQFRRLTNRESLSVWQRREFDAIIMEKRR